MLYATDSCGTADTLEACIWVEEGDIAAIQRPTSLDTIVCEPGTICFDLPIEGTVLSTTATLGEWSMTDEGGQFCIEVRDDISAQVTLMAESECNTDTCVFDLNIIVLDQPVVQCPELKTVALCGPDTLVANLILSNGVNEFYNLMVSEPAWLAGEGDTVQVFIPVFDAGTQTITAVYTADGCAADTCSFDVTTTLNSPPTVMADDTTLTICELTEICVPYAATDIDGNLDTVYSSLARRSSTSVRARRSAALIARRRSGETSCSMMVRRTRAKFASRRRASANTRSSSLPWTPAAPRPPTPCW